jgi:hypothetical protein
LRNNYYKVTNISNQRITLSITTQDGRQIEDYLEEREVVYGLNERAAFQLKYYEWMGVIKIERTEFSEDPKVRWLVEGF